LGYWLGDGTTGLPVIASDDIEVQKYIFDWCEEMMVSWFMKKR
jgi:hypothetical protein